MGNAGRFVLLVAVLAAGTAAFPAGQVPLPPGQTPPPPAVGTGFIAGQVIDVLSGKPIPEVTVTMVGRVIVNGRASQGGSPPVMTDAQGRFFFANLPAGVFAFSVDKPGYITPRSGAFLSVELAEGERVIDAKTRLAKVASLSGTLRDEAGDPVVGTDVLVLRWTITNGRQTLQVFNKSRSDDRGQYRAGNLTPGDYVVCACGRDVIPFDNTLLTTLGSEPLQLMTVAARALSVGSDVVSLDNTLRTYPPRLYPNAVTLARATKITVAPGEERLGVDLNLPLVHSARVSGTVVGAASPVQAGSMRLVPAPDGEANADLFSLPPILVQADGRFDFATVPPGQYRLMMVHRETGARGGGPSGAAMSFLGPRGAAQPPAATMSAVGLAPAPNMPTLWANEPIVVGDNGVTGFVISLNRAPSITGRAQWIGAAPPPTAQMLNRASIVMQPLSFLDPLAAIAGIPIGRFSPDATFVVPGAVPGKYTFTSNPLPGYPTLKSVTVGGLDITDLAFEVGEKDIAEVVITFVDAPMGSLTVNAGPGRPGAITGDDASVLVFPVDRKYWADPSAGRRRYRSLPLTGNGLTTTPEMPTGEYFVVVVGGLDAVDWMEATRLEALSKRAQRVTIPDTGTARIEVRR